MNKIDNRQLRFFSLVDSTNDVAKQYKKDQEANQILSKIKKPENIIWFLGAMQSKGRGRRDLKTNQNKIWQSPIGNLYISNLLYIGDFGKRNLTHLTFVAGLAIRDALQKIVTKTENFEKILLKWPNDLMIDGKKCGGILLEIYLDYLICGFGVNIAEVPVKNPHKHEFEATCINDNFPKVSVLEVARALMDSFDVRLQQLKTKGFLPLRKDWRDCAFRIGQQVKIKLKNQTIRGIFVDIDHDGAMKIKTNGEIKKVFAGELFAN